MVFFLANKHPMSLVPTGGEVGHEIAQYLHIAEASEETKEEEE